MSDSFAPTVLFLVCNCLYHKLRASDEALACGYCGIAATPRLRVGWGVGRRFAGEQRSRARLVVHRTISILRHRRCRTLSHLRRSFSTVIIYTTSCAHLTKRLHVATEVSRLCRACVSGAAQVGGRVPRGTSQTDRTSRRRGMEHRFVNCSVFCLAEICIRSYDAGGMGSLKSNFIQGRSTSSLLK